MICVSISVSRAITSCVPWIRFQWLAYPNWRLVYPFHNISFHFVPKFIKRVSESWESIISLFESIIIMSISIIRESKSMISALILNPAGLLRKLWPTRYKFQDTNFHFSIKTWNWLHSLYFLFMSDWWGDPHSSRVWPCQVVEVKKVVIYLASFKFLVLLFCSSFIPFV